MDSLSTVRQAGRLNFTDAWKFLNSYGSLYFKSSTGHVFEAKAGKETTANGAVRIIKFVEDKDTIAWVGEDCWNQKDVCSGIDILTFREIVKSVIQTAYVE